MCALPLPNGQSREGVYGSYKSGREAGERGAGEQRGREDLIIRTRTRYGPVFMDRLNDVCGVHNGRMCGVNNEDWKVLQRCCCTTKKHQDGVVCTAHALFLSGVGGVGMCFVSTPRKLLKAVLDRVEALCKKWA